MSFTIFQNGGREETMEYTNSLDESAAVGSQSLNLGSIDGHKRPQELKMSPRKGYVPERCRGDSEEDEGSLPCTPELQSDSEAEGSNCSAGEEALVNDTRELIKTFLRQHTGLPQPRWKTSSRALSTMVRVVDGVLEKHRYAYNGMINNLSLDDREDAKFVRQVAESLFGDRATNWGRIASLTSFGAAVSKALKDKGRPEFVDMVADEISSYLLSDQRDWLIKNNAWDGFVDFFRVADPESSVRNALMAVAGFAGLGATLALLIR